MFARGAAGSGRCRPGGKPDHFGYPPEVIHFELDPPWGVGPLVMGTGLAEARVAMVIWGSPEMSQVGSRRDSE